MRNLVCSIAAVAAVLLVACGASSKEVAMAKTARYSGDKLQIFAAAKATVEAKYEVAKTDETTLTIQSKGHWYSPDGLSQTPRGEGTEAVDLVDKSINFAVVVAFMPDGDNWIVKITPVMTRFNKGSPQPEPLKEGQADLPGWVESKLDTLALDIHTSLAKWEVKSGGAQMVPAGNAPAAEAPQAGDGSAASAGAPGGSAAP